MKRAEKAALEKYPHNCYGGTLGDSLRAACMIGYHQAEKDIHKRLFQIGVSSNPMDYVHGVHTLTDELEKEI